MAILTLDKQADSTDVENRVKSLFKYIVNNDISSKIARGLVKSINELTENEFLSIYELPGYFPKFDELPVFLPNLESRSMMIFFKKL